MTILSANQIKDSMSNYLGSVSSLLCDFNELLPPAADPVEELENRKKFFMSLALYGLPTDYSHVRDQILGSPTEATMENTWATLLRVPAKVLTMPSSVPVDSSALVSRHKGPPPRKGGKGRPWCDHCHRPGHTIDKCWSLHGRPPRAAQIVQSSVAPSASTSQLTPDSTSTPSYTDFLKWFEDRQASGSTATIADAGTSFAGISRSSGPWVLDSGATDHITGNKSLFSSLTTSGNLPMVTMANGSQTQSQGIGIVHPSSSLSIHNVLYVPGAPFNLLSISQLTRSLDCVISFTNTSVSLQDRSTGRMIGFGCESHGLYRLQQPSFVGSAAASPLLIHAQLGHPGLNKLKQLHPSLSHLESLSCASCQLGKHVRSSFSPRIESRAMSPFALVHSDVWGPSRVSSTMGSRYFVTFIDDFSRCTWLYLMKDRSELFSIFESFFLEIKTQFGTSLRTLQSDNAREYLSTQFRTFLTSHGVLHRTSCPHTPQQNGVAERKNRHLLETTRTLLLHSHVPHQFWGDVVLTACYLINRMPSSTLQGKIPHQVLYPHQSLHPLPPRVFGSICFAHALDPGIDKLSPRSHKCVFLGYPRSQKGYKCYSPTLRRYFISADVTFFESVSFFGPSASQAEVSPSPPAPVTIFYPPEAPLSSPVSSPPLQVYQRRPRSALPSTNTDTTVGTSLEPSPSPFPPVPSPDSDVPIALRKGMRSTRNPSPHYVSLSYHRLSPSYYYCLSSLSSVSLPKTAGDAFAHPGWKQAMLDEMSALQSSGTWDLVPLPPGKSVVSCR